MPIKNNPVRYAHTDGHTDVCYSEEGKYILTCGNDGDIRVYLGLEDDDPTSHCVGENALALAQKGSKLYVGTDDNTLRCYKFPQMERDGILNRFTKPVTHICVSRDGNTVVAASESSEIYVLDIMTGKSKMLSGHSGPILSVAIDPKVEFLASSSGDGRVCVWELDSATKVQSWECVSACGSFFEARSLCRVSWQPDGGQLLAVPQENQVVLYKKGSWQRWHVLSHPTLEKDVSICSFSPCGKFLAASSMLGDIVVWNVLRKSCVGITKHDKKRQICGLAWNPNGSGEIAFSDFTGQLGTVVGCMEEDPQVPNGIVQEEPEYSVGSLTNGMDSDDDDDDENAISLEKIKSQAALPLSDDVLESASIAGESEDEEDARSEKLSMSELQPPFQPSATPLHLQHRFMVWNSVGLVRCSSAPEEVIDVEFHDTATHHALHIRNLQHYHVASLTEHALVLASESEDDCPSKVLCILLDCWDGSREWSVDLPAGEGALCVASGSRWVAVATDTRLLRVWTLSGAQREVVVLPGPVLCLAQHVHTLLVTCHLAPGVCGDQNVGYALMCMERGRLSSWQPLPLTPRSTLHWLGYTDEGSPCLHDSSGSMRLLGSRGYWLPILHTASLVKGKSDHYFVLGISETCQNVRAVLCKGSRYPPTAPRPPVVELPLQVGLADVTTDRGQLEELFWRSTIAMPAAPAEQTLRAAKEASIKLFAMACRAGQQARAVELCTLMADEQVVQLALKYASKLGKTQLANRIAQLDLSHLDEPSFSHREHEVEVRPWRRCPARTGDYESEKGNTTDEDSVDSAHIEGRSSFLMPTSRMLEPQKSQEQDLNTSGHKGNPFKKSTGQLQMGRGLANLASLPRSSPMLKSITAKFSPAEGGTKQAHIPLHSSGNKLSKVGGLPVFVKWYPQQEARLKLKFPSLNTLELTKQALNEYRQLQKKEGAQSKNSMMEPVPTSCAEGRDDQSSKRKLGETENLPAKKPALTSDTEDEDDQSSKRKLADVEILPAKKPALTSDTEDEDDQSSKRKLGETENLPAKKPALTSDTEDEDDQSSKRKLADVEILPAKKAALTSGTMDRGDQSSKKKLPAKKPVSSSSKLTAFLFKKS